MSHTVIGEPHPKIHDRLNDITEYLESLYGTENMNYVILIHLKEPVDGMNNSEMCTNMNIAALADFLAVSAEHAASVRDAAARQEGETEQ